MYSDDLRFEANGQIYQKLTDSEIYGYEDGAAKCAGN